MACECNIVGLLTSSIPGIFSASVDGSTTIEIAEDGLVLLGQTINTLNIGAYAFLPGQNRFLGASCPVTAQANIPWITKEDCVTGQSFFIPRAGGSASTTGLDASGVSRSIIDLTCTPGIVDTSFNADAGSGPASPFFFSEREDGYNLVYTGHPIPIESGKPKSYTISLGFIGTIQGFLQSFSLSVNPPEVARVQYSFTFTGVTPP